MQTLQTLNIGVGAAQDKDALAQIDGVVRELRSRPRLLLDFERFVPRADRAWFRACSQCAGPQLELALKGCSFLPDLFSGFLLLYAPRVPTGVGGRLSYALQSPLACKLRW